LVEDNDAPPLLTLRTRRAVAEKICAARVSTDHTMRQYLPFDVDAVDVYVNSFSFALNRLKIFR
jgi:hypothetical protein